MGRLMVLLLAAAVFASALGVVFSTHESRRLFVELQALQKVRDEMNAQWGRLQLEQSTWATHGRIERIANEKLDMIIPPPGAVVIVRP
ncbi:MAG: cell division protein FtsL [Gammaproteobacteria bacterium]|nr:cell division protein FtsL [Gammaproteobacteria bacterium]MCW8840074.1 cell division protein FtsL [Gammaproteobacteria bacterium]MCW8927960.1 cell division protein FtsL [Gammaproteobacteria bacterium]MCW8959726.1 cell division protein FtsL [Gammaproteobacteria bacterium]MCW8971923.1 cell division protein FtsL [Gammaproteobacteria bacterium]